MRKTNVKSKKECKGIRRFVNVAVIVTVIVTLFIMFAVATSADMTSQRILPNTGGRGRIAIYASGSAIVTGCVVYGITTLRMKKKNEDEKFDEEFDEDSDDSDSDGNSD